LGGRSGGRLGRRGCRRGRGQLAVDVTARGNAVESAQIALLPRCIAVPRGLEDAVAASRRNDVRASPCRRGAVDAARAAGLAIGTVVDPAGAICARVALLCPDDVAVAADLLGAVGPVPAVGAGARAVPRRPAVANAPVLARADALARGAVEGRGRGDAAAALGVRVDAARARVLVDHVVVGTERTLAQLDQAEDGAAAARAGHAAGPRRGVRGRGR